MIDDLTDRCREALETCPRHPEDGGYIRIGDAAACMARALRARFHDTSASLEVALRAAAQEAP